MKKFARERLLESYRGSIKVRARLLPGPFLFSASVNSPLTPNQSSSSNRHGAVAGAGARLPNRPCCSSPGSQAMPHPLPSPRKSRFPFFPSYSPLIFLLGLWISSPGFGRGLRSHRCFIISRRAACHEHTNGQDQPNSCLHGVLLE
jgi:hypothetical protein